MAALVKHRPDVAVSSSGCRHLTDEGVRAAIAAPRRVPGLPILVLSQYVEQLYASELLFRPAGRGGLPAQGPASPMWRSSSMRAPGRRRRHRDGPRGGRPAADSRAREQPLGSLTRCEREVLRSDGRGQVQRRDRGQDVRH